MKQNISLFERSIHFSDATHFELIKRFLQLPAFINCLAHLFPLNANLKFLILQIKDVKRPLFLRGQEYRLSAKEIMRHCELFIKRQVFKGLCFLN